MLHVTTSLCTAWAMMTETWGWPKCSLCHFVLVSPCFFFPSCHPGSLSFPSAMRAVWEVGAGFSALCPVVWSEVEHLPSAMQPTYQAAHFVHLLSSRILLPTVPFFFFLPKILLSLFDTETDVHTTWILAQTKSVQGNGENSGGSVLC